MDLNKILKTERLALIPVTLEYAQDIFENFNDIVTKYMYPCPSENISQTIDVVNSFIKKREKGMEVVYAITLLENGEFLGLAGLHGLTREIPELGIWTKLSSHGNHYGREAIGGVIDFARESGIKKLCYPVDERNIPSKKIPIYYGGVVVREKETEITPDNRILNVVTYEIELN